MSGNDGTVSYLWTLNANTVSYSGTYTVPTTAKVGDLISVTVTDADGNTASDSVIVGATTELALESVEGAAIDRASGTYNVVIAYFNQPVDDLAAGDIQIRRVSDDQLFSVESVALSSDGMKATITLANSGSAGASVVGLRPNVDYNMIVTSEGDTASKIFSIPAVVDDVIVSAFDADKGTIVVGTGNDGLNGAWNWSETSSLTVPEDMTIDYNDLLGRTVTVKYDKKMNITSLVVDPDETVIYGAFKGSTDNKNLTEVVSEATFKAQDNAAGTIDPSTLIAKTPTGWNAPAALTTGTLTNDALAYTWGKLVLNPNNTIKALVSDDRAWDTYMLVTGVVDNTILAGTSEQNLKDYTILENGYTLDIEDIEEGDLVFVDRTNKFAVVYNNAETGELEAVYDGKFTFGGETYDVVHTGTPAKLDSTVYYNKSGEGRTRVDNDYLNALVAGGEDVTVYFGLNGQPAYLTGELGETVTTTETLVLTADSKFYTEKLSNYFRVKGFNDEEVKTYDIDLSKLEFIVDEAGTTHKKGYTKYAKGTPNPAKNDNAKGFKVGTTPIDTAGNGSISQDGGDADIITNATLGKKALITLTKNDKDQIIGINFEDIATGTGDALADNIDFKSGLKVVNGLQLDGSAPVYIYQVNGSKANTVTVRDYSGFNGVVAKANKAKVHVYSSNDKDVSAIVIESDGLSGDTSGQTVEEVVVKSSKRNTESTTKLAELTVIYQGEEYTYTKFDSAVAALDSPTAGDIYTLTINKDGETVDGLAIVTDLHRTTITVTSVDSQEFTLDPTNLNLTKRKLATTVEPTIVKFEDGAYVPGTFADLQDADTTNTTASNIKQINWSWLAGSTDYVDTIVVTGTTAAALAAAKTAENTKITGLAGAVTAQTASVSSATSSTFDVSGITAADIDLAGSSATAASTDFTAGTVTLAGAASTLATTGASAADTATITITTALGNNITIKLTTEAARAATGTFTPKDITASTNFSTATEIGTVSLKDQYGEPVTISTTDINGGATVTSATGATTNHASITGGFGFANASGKVYFKSSADTTGENNSWTGALTLASDGNLVINVTVTSDGHTGHTVTGSVD